MLKRIILSPWLAIITLLVLLSIRWTDPAFVESIRLRYFDTLITSAPVTENNIHIVNIDEAALDKYGQWPFGRDVYADIITDLYARGAGLVIWNIMMPEADRAGQDAVLAQTLKEYPVVLPLIGADRTKNTPTNPGAVIIGDPAGKVVEYPGILSSIESLGSQAQGQGISTVFPEIDGVVRRMPLVIQSGDILYPALGLEVLRILAGDPSFQIKFNELGIEKLRVPAFGMVTTDPIGRVWIDLNQRSQQHALTNLPDNFDAGIVIVGTSAAGLNNPVATAVGEIWPHHLQASIIGTLANGRVITRPDWADGAEIIVIFLLGLIAIFLTRWKHGYIIFLVGGVFSYFAGIYVFERTAQLVDVSYGIFALGIAYMHAYTVKFLTELNQKLQIKKQFGTYLSPAMVEKLQQNPALLKLGGERRELSIMFTDVRGFTAISEHYGDNVEGLTEIMNRYMTAMTGKIIENNGTLDKYIGDAQMAFWNAPLDDAEHAKNAVKTALAMMEDLDAFNAEIAQEGVPAFGMGLGINTGDVIVGNMGSSQRFDYTCLGDAVNLASRLEGQSKNYGVRIILGEKTARQIQDDFNIVELDTIAVKGKKVGIKIFTLSENTNWFDHANWLKYYYKGDWQQARKYLRTLYNLDNDLKQYYTNMLARIDEGLPADWDGVYRATSK